MHVGTYEIGSNFSYKRFLRNSGCGESLKFGCKPMADLLLENCIRFSCILRYSLLQIVDKHFPQFPVAFTYLKFIVLLISAHFLLVGALAQFSCDIINGKFSLESNMDLFFVFFLPFVRSS